MVAKIEAREVYLKDLFGDKFLFEIPDFQRQFAWEKENFDQLVDDIKDALDTFEGEEPYFLGSIILWTQQRANDGSGLYAVIDGQQRLTALVILMACLRDLTEDKKAKKALQERIYQEADEYSGTQECVRVKIREREYDFFKEYILTEKGTEQLRYLDYQLLSEPKQHMVQAAKVFYDAFVNEKSVDNDLIKRLVKYLLQQVVIVVVTTGSLASGFRLFNVINARGMPLSNADLLKSENLRVISEDLRSKYTRIWEGIEEEIGVDNLEMLISFIRSIYLKEKARRAIYEEFESRIYKENPDFKGQRFVEYVDSVSSIYKMKIEDCSVSFQDSHEEVYYYNLVSIMRDFLPFNDWMAALIRFVDKFPDDGYLLDFVMLLEKKIAVEWIKGLSFTERLTQIYRIIRIIDNADTPQEVLSSKVFDVESYRTEFTNALNNVSLYNRGRTRVPKYILLRLDMERQDNLHKKIAFSGNITVEHILPRTPTHEYWLSRFNGTARLEWTNRLGNLALLNGRKNSRASNRPFSEKVNNYFAKRSDFDVTNELGNFSEWNLTNLMLRHQHLCDEALDVWIG